MGIDYAFSDRFTALGQYGLLDFSTVNNKTNNGTKIDTDTNFNLGMNTVDSSIFNVGIYYTLIK